MARKKKFTPTKFMLPTSVVLNMCLHYFLKGKIETDIVTLDYFATMLWCSKKICAMKDNKLKPFIADLECNFKVFKKLASKIPLPSKSFSDGDLITEYIKILFLMDIRNYNKVMKGIGNNIENFQGLYESLGELDLSICILSFRESLSCFCLLEFHHKNTVCFQGIYHPLLTTPIANDAVISNNCIITGSNASGKSTFIKAIAINGILAQTIQTCTSHSYISKAPLVITSMAVKDNISAGDSYFITEIKSLKRILDKISHCHCICLIDEILKGTNTIERIAASAAVLKYMHEKDCLCMVASHDIELTEILKNEYDNYHFSEQITDGGISFDYLLKQGASQTKNAIQLLRFLNFNDELVENAEILVGKFISTRKW